MSQSLIAGQHCVVIGAGTVGVCCAWHLRRSGFEVTLIDRLEPGQATSFGNAAGISPSQVVPFSYPGMWRKIPRWLFDPLGPLTIRWRDLPAVAPWLWRFWRAGSATGVQRAASAQASLMHQVHADYDDLLGESGLQTYLQSKGLVQIYDQQAHFEADRWSLELGAELGFQWQPMSAAELQDKVPALGVQPAAAVFIPSWQHVTNPAEMTAAIARSAISLGAKWLHEEVTTVTANEQEIRLVLSSGQPLVADRLVVAAGPWSNHLASQLDHAVPMTPKRGYHSQVPEPGFALECPVLSASRHFVMVPQANGFRMAGTAEFARLDAAPDYRRADVLMEHAKHYFPTLKQHGVSRWLGQRPMMVDSLPIISTSPRHSNVLYAFGHGHYGLTQGPTTGRIISQLAAGQSPGLDIGPYRFDRFTQ